MVWKSKRNKGVLPSHMRGSTDPEYYFRKVDQERRRMAESKEPPRKIVTFIEPDLPKKKVLTAEPKKPGRKRKEKPEGKITVKENVFVNFG